MDDVRERLRDLLKRAGLSNVPPTVLAAVLAVSVIGVVLGLRHWWPGGGDVVAATETAQPASAQGTINPSTGRSAAQASAAPSSGPSPQETPGPSGQALYVHVVGAVRRPGLYRVNSGSRVADAVDAAGGLLGNAAERGLNLARPIEDGEQIVVPTQDELEANPGPIEQQNSLAAGPTAGTGGSGAGGASTTPRVNVNTADVSALDTLPGVGPSTAQKIVAEREANGPFASADDLARVPGIGPKKLEALRDMVVTR